MHFEKKITCVDLVPNLMHLVKKNQSANFGATLMLVQDSPLSTMLKSDNQGNDERNSLFRATKSSN